MSHPPRLLLHPDAGPTVGAGHLARCLALAQAWVDTGGTAVLATADVPPDWARRYVASGIDLCHAGDAPPYGDADWTVLDGYRFTGASQAAVKESGSRLLSIHDYGPVARNLADVILDQNLGSTPAAYGRPTESTDLLLGPRYALLRREFRNRVPPARVTRATGRRLLVSMGGSPTVATSDTFSRVLADPAVKHLEVIELEGVDDVVPAMTSADLALSASGSTCWELCCTGLPAVLVPVANNQVPLAAALGAHGAADDAGGLGATDPAAVAERVARLAEDPDRRARMSRRGQALVDGRGAKRVTARLRSELLHLRPADAGDARVLWEWANDPVVRAAAFNTAPISWEDHVEWLARRIADPGTTMYVAHTPDRQAAGVVRFQRRGSTSEISVALAAEQRGHGWGPAVIDAGVRRLFAESPVREVLARIKSDNRPSWSSFDLAGFAGSRSSVGAGGEAAHSWIELFRRNDARQPICEREEG